MHDPPRQSLYCHWKSFQIWGLVVNNEIIHLSFDKARHRTICGNDEPESVCPTTQKEMCAFLLSTLEGRATDFPQNSLYIRNGSPFQHKVWRALCRIPFATTRTYGEIASELGNPHLARAVGQACNKNPLPLIIPCHRVVSSTGLGGFAGGSRIKQALLDYESAWQQREVEGEEIDDQGNSESQARDIAKKGGQPHRPQR